MPSVLAIQFLNHFLWKETRPWVSVLARTGGTAALIHRHFFPSHVVTAAEQNTNTGKDNKPCRNNSASSDPYSSSAQFGRVLCFWRIYVAASPIFVYFALVSMIRHLCYPSPLPHQGTFTFFWGEVLYLTWHTPVEYLFIFSLCYYFYWDYYCFH